MVRGLAYESTLPLKGGEKSSFGMRIRQIRRQQNLTLDAFGDLVGFSRVSIWKWEQGTSVPKHSNLVKIAEALDLPLSFLGYGVCGDEGPATTDLTLNKDIGDIIMAARISIAKAASVPLDNVIVSLMYR